MSFATFAENTFFREFICVFIDCLQISVHGFNNVSWISAMTFLWIASVLWTPSVASDTRCVQLFISICLQTNYLHVLAMNSSANEHLETV